MDISPSPHRPAPGSSVKCEVLFVFKHLCKNRAQGACFQTLAQKSENKSRVLRHLRKSKSPAVRTPPASGSSVSLRADVGALYARTAFFSYTYRKHGCNPPVFKHLRRSKKISHLFSYTYETGKADQFGGNRAIGNPCRPASPENASVAYRNHQRGPGPVDS